MIILIAIVLSVYMSILLMGHYVHAESQLVTVGGSKLDTGSDISNLIGYYLFYLHEIASRMRSDYVGVLGLLCSVYD